MDYLFATWKSGDSSMPIEIYSELDDRRLEVRKVEKFDGGRYGFASSRLERPPTRLSPEPVPSAVEIRREGEFKARDGTRAEFEAIWKQATAGA